MTDYYINSIICGANRREFEDQSVIKGKLKSNGIRPNWSLILGEEESKKNVERGRRGRRKRKERKPRKVWIEMVLYGYLDFYMDISLFHF